MVLNMSNEIWKDVLGYEGLYEVSNLGRIKKKFKHKEIICKPSEDYRGYKQIVLTKDHKRKSFKVHRLVAQVFIPNPNNLPQINHKDENKLNNRIDNLEWCTQQFNNNYGTRNYRCTRHLLRKVEQIDCISKSKIKEYNSLKGAEEETKIKYQDISMCCRGIIHKAGGYIWRYVE